MACENIEGDIDFYKWNEALPRPQEVSAKKNKASKKNTIDNSEQTGQFEIWKKSIKYSGKGNTSLQAISPITHNIIFVVGNLASIQIDYDKVVATTRSEIQVFSIRNHDDQDAMEVVQTLTLKEPAPSYAEFGTLMFK